MHIHAMPIPKLCLHETVGRCSPSKAVPVLLAEPNMAHRAPLAAPRCNGLP